MHFYQCFTIEMPFYLQIFQTRIYSRISFVLWYQYAVNRNYFKSQRKYHSAFDYKKTAFRKLFLQKNPPPLPQPTD